MPIRFVCLPSGRLRAILPVRSATWSSRRITATTYIKPPHYAYRLYQDMRGRFHHRGEKLALIRHHRLFTHLLPHDYPDLTLSGREGVSVLRTARAAADRPFRRLQR